MGNSSDLNQTKSLIILYPNASQGNAYLQTVNGHLEGEESVQVVEANTVHEVTEHVREHSFALLIFCVRNKDDLSLVLNGLNDWNSQIRGKFLRVIGVSQLNHPQVQPTLMKRGCADLFSATLNAKSLKHKINQSLKIVETYRSQNAGAVPQFSSSKDSGTKEKSAAAPEKAQSAWNKSAALTLASDVWLIRSERDARLVQGRWIIDMIGPGPSAGFWDESPNEKNLWVWKPKETEDSKAFITDPGEWCYRGRRPDFVSETSRWRFVGDAPELFFRNGGQAIAFRLKLSREGGVIAENSEQARAKLPAIGRSIENEVRFRKDQAKQGHDPEVHDLAEKAPEFSDGYALKGEVDETPFNQAPKPKLRITLQSAQTGAGKPVMANPIELSDDFLLLEVPAGMFAPEEALIIVMDDGMHTPRSKQRLNAKLKEIVGSEGETDQVSISVDPELRVSFAPVQAAIKERQEEIFNFLKAARGW